MDTQWVGVLQVAAGRILAEQASRKLRIFPRSGTGPAHTTVAKIPKIQKSWFTTGHGGL
jgi:hypothetical protein